MISWKTLLAAIALVESSGNSGAVNHSENAVGLYQIRPAYVQDANEYARWIGRHDLHFIHPDDMFCPVKSEQVMILYMMRYAGENPTPEKIARIHNGGPRGYRKTATESYWQRVKTNLY